MKDEKTKSRQGQSPKQLHIHIERYQGLLEILEDRRKVWRLAGIVLIVGVALFLGISILVLQLKKSFTYSDITTNALGVTTIADEQKEVSYFLFNTAELWANSGISVEAGDVISIYSSGAAHTAIHKLYDAAKENREVGQKYFDSDGNRDGNESERDKLRSQYRIFPGMPQNAVIMQVSNTIPKDEQHFAFLPDSASQDCFYYIGGKREKIRIRQSGVLFFTVNDIVLDEETILKMEMENLLLMQYYKGDTVIAKVGRGIFKKMNALTDNKIICDTFQNNVSRLEFKEKDKVQRMYGSLQDIIAASITKDLEDRYVQYKKSNFSFGAYYKSTDVLKTEMDYYFEHKYKQAWFDDNIGSFLIVIEKENSNLSKHGK